MQLRCGCGICLPKCCAPRCDFLTVSGREVRCGPECCGPGCSLRYGSECNVRTGIATVGSSLSKTLGTGICGTGVCSSLLGNKKEGKKNVMLTCLLNVVSQSGQGSKTNYGVSVDKNDTGVSGWSTGNKVGNIENTGVGSGNRVDKTKPAPAKGFFGCLLS